MSDVALATPPTEPLGNDPSMRDPTGTIKEPTTSTTEPTKPVETKPAETAKPAEGVPDKYEFKPPEGRELDTKLIESATPVFKELGLTQAQAQGLFDLHNKLNADASAQLEQTMTAMRTEWRDKITADPALGDGKGNLNDAAKKDISTAMAAVGDAKAVADFKAALDLTGAGDHPAIASALRSLGRLLGEGTAVKGGGASPAGQKAPGSGPKTAAQAIYGNLPSSNA